MARKSQHLVAKISNIMSIEVDKSFNYVENL